jgi:hypothetical protein
MTQVRRDPHDDRQRRADAGARAGDDMNDRRPDDHTERVQERAPHEDDSDVAGQAGGGILDAGMTAEDRGTGDRFGNAQGLDDEATGVTRGGGDGEAAPLVTPLEAAPGIGDFGDTEDEAGESGRH